MRPCAKCRYAALCVALGGASEVASHLVHNGKQEVVVCDDLMQYAGGGPAPIPLNVDAAAFYRTRPKDCPGSQQ